MHSASDSQKDNQKDNKKDNGLFSSDDALPVFDRRHLSRELELEFDDSSLLLDVYGQYLIQLTDMQTDLCGNNPLLLSRKEIAHYSHRLKSSSHAVGAMQLADCLKRLENAALQDQPELESLLGTARLLLTQTHNSVETEISRLLEGKQ